MIHPLTRQTSRVSGFKREPHTVCFPRHYSTPSLSRSFAQNPSSSRIITPTLTIPHPPASPPHPLLSRVEKFRRNSNNSDDDDTSATSFLRKIPLGRRFALHQKSSQLLERKQVAETSFSTQKGKKKLVNFSTHNLDTRLHHCYPLFFARPHKELDTYHRINRSNASSPFTRKNKRNEKRKEKHFITEINSYNAT